MSSRWAKILTIVRLFTKGRDRVDPGGPAGLSRIEELLTWPTRVAVVAGVLGIAAVWASTPAGVQLGWALQYIMLAAVSVATSLWLILLLVNVAAAASWVALSRTAPPERDEPSSSWGPLDVVTWINRQIGHAEAAGIWVAVVLVSFHGLKAQLGCLAGLGLLVPPFINRIARTQLHARHKIAPSHAAIMMERRALIYGLSLLGLLVLIARAPRQVWVIAPLLLTVLPGLGLRYVRFLMRRRQEHRAPDPARVRRHRLAGAEMQRKAARFTGWVAPAIVMAFFGAVIGLSAWQRGRLETSAAIERDGPPLPSDHCEPETGGPVAPSVALFLIADTQMHELGGKRFPGQMEFADALVPVARRPVELDMLSTAAVVRYQSVYEQLQRQRAAANPPLPAPLWGHLGDLADLGCEDEVKRMFGLMASYGKTAQGDQKLLAGIAPGNHDITFQGNFEWSPYWDGACDARMNKAKFDAALAEVLDARKMAGAHTDEVKGWAPAAFFGKSPLARFTVSPLGVLSGQASQGPSGVVGIFIDTSDRGARNFGIAGEFGTFSEAQRDAIADNVHAIRGAAASRGSSDPWVNPWFVIFGHVPYGALTPSSRKELNRLIESLDGRSGDCKKKGTDCSPPRVIALVTAHTHTAGSHRQCIGDRLVREIVVGSVIDPPQQASLLEIGLDARGRGAARLSTMPLVAREGFMCEAGNAIPARACRETLAKLGAAPACEDLLAGTRGTNAEDVTCDELERTLPLTAQIEGIVKHAGPDDPDELKAADTKRAATLLRCLCREVPQSATPGTCATAQRRPLESEAYASVIEALAHDPARQQELACLSWAAAVVQSHKATGMTIADAIRCAFDDSTLPPAQVTVAVTEEVPCY